MDQASPITCPLCRGSQTPPFHRDKRRNYRRCLDCQLVFVAAEQHLSVDEEKAIYDLHENDPADPGYRQFLSRLAIPLSHRLPPNATGLDYGCGPGPALAALFKERGFAMQMFDPLYADDQKVLKQRYDFITATEVVEHFRNPHDEFERLFSLLHPQGYLGVMTKLVIDAEAFARWHYKNDPTHISFFSIPTFRWLAEKYGCKIKFLQRDVVIFQTS
ncbi:class I SAM-dependent methyltransferase [Methylomarinum vadi]|uniref:class I SAM-dependent methyltransferase n=1 Tax=Methylomarinum vadi TaxID=438855 RepID=UPI0004DF5396|nr:class I SAM-dependent methyltransferase [Methylomarinum vadi]